MQAANTIRGYVRRSNLLLRVLCTRSISIGLVASITASVQSGCSRQPADGQPLVVVKSLGEVGSSPGQFSYPRCIDSDGTNLWVIDKAARVQKIDTATGAAIAAWRMPQWQNGKPTGITCWRGADGRELIFIADTHYHRIMVYAPQEGVTPIIAQSAVGKLSYDGTPSGQSYVLVSSFGSYGTNPGEFTYPTDIAIIPDDKGNISRLYITEYGGADRVSVFQPSGDGEYKVLFTFGAFGSSSSANRVEFNRPQAILYDAKHRELIISDACNHRIGRFNPEGTLIAWLPAVHPGHARGELMYPYGITLLPDRTLLIAEYGNNRLQRLDVVSGESLGTFGQQGRGTGQLVIPWAVTYIQDIAYVLDSGNNRIVGFATPVSPLAHSGKGGT